MRWFATMCCAYAFATATTLVASLPVGSEIYARQNKRFDLGLNIVHQAGLGSGILLGGDDGFIPWK